MNHNTHSAHSGHASQAVPPKPPRSLTPLVLILLVCLAPVVLALLAYYLPAMGVRPAGSSNYGTLITPQRPLPDSSVLPLITLDGRDFDNHSLKGKWILMLADSGNCDEPCVKKLFTLRNSHASQGKNVERLARIWFVTDDAPISSTLLKAYEGTIIVRAKPEQLANFLSPDAGAADAALATSKAMWVMDPLGNLMLQFPDDADPVRVRNDISKLVRNSRVG